MEMTIDKAIEIIESAKNFSYDAEYDNAFDVAIETMRKYEKIEQIINNAKESDGAVKYNWLYERIREVIEDGNDDN